jgi:hypothetical protein
MEDQFKKPVAVRMLFVSVMSKIRGDTFVMDKGSPLPNGTDGESDNVEEVEIWEPLRIISKDIEILIDIKIINAGEVEIWKSLRVIRDGIGIPPYS